MPIARSRFRSDPFVVERPAYLVLRDGHAPALSPKLVGLLPYFVSRPSVLVTKDELCAAVWPDVAVTENALDQARAAIAELVRGGRILEVAVLSTMAAAAQGRPTDAIGLLDRLLTAAGPGLPVWTIPIEPMFRPLHAQPEFAGIPMRHAGSGR